jgi:hypothetical protein
MSVSPLAEVDDEDEEEEEDDEDEEEEEDGEEEDGEEEDGEEEDGKEDESMSDEEIDSLGDEDAEVSESSGLFAQETDEALMFAQPTTISTGTAPGVSNPSDEGLEEKASPPKSKRAKAKKKKADKKAPPEEPEAAESDPAIAEASCATSLYEAGCKKKKDEEDEAAEKSESSLDLIVRAEAVQELGGEFAGISGKLRRALVEGDDVALKAIEEKVDAAYSAVMASNAT